ncbi:MAG: hypothetical protein L0Y71_23995 [Gemmataceae bacterium]|nr:hypothetical protein [Gemmataceae bacterium]
MTDYQIQPHTRRCLATGRDLQPGERYYTALVEDGDHFVRQDFSSQAWQGPPAGAFSFWSGRVPQPNEIVKARFDDDVLEQCFQRLDDQPSRVNFRYVVALLLIRRKRLRFEQTIDDDGVEKLELTNAKTGAKYLVTNPQLSDEQIAEVQDEVFRVLGWS